jgi:hypothetical protein
MAEVEVMENRESDPTALAAEATAMGGGKPRKPRITDGGPEILPDMGNYVNLVRKIKHRALVVQWLHHLHTEELPGIEWDHKVCASYKQSLFTVVAGLSGVIRQRLEDAAQRILLLSDGTGQSLQRGVVPGHWRVQDRLGAGLPYLPGQRRSEDHCPPRWRQQEAPAKGHR